MNDQTGYDATIQLPEGASTLAPHVDSLYYDIFWISVAFFVAIVGCMVWFAYRFRRRKGVKSKPPGHHTALELFWTFSPLLLLAYMFHQGFEGYMMMNIPPANAINIRAEARQWSWSFLYPTGKVDGELTVPIHQPVRMIMSSHPRGVDHPAVLHSFFVPALRVKRDIVPGMYTSLWFEATRLGTYDIYCAEYCGLDPIQGELTDQQIHNNGRPLASVGHSGMLSRLHVVTMEEYTSYARTGRPDEFETNAAWGSTTPPPCRCGDRSRPRGCPRWPTPSRCMSAWGSRPPRSCSSPRTSTPTSSSWGATGSRGWRTGSARWRASSSRRRSCPC